FDLAKGQTIKTAGLPGDVSDVAVHPSGKELIVCISRGQVVFADVETGKELRRVPAYDELTLSADVSPDDKYVASGGKNRIVLWERATGKRLQDFHGHDSYVKGVRFTADGKRLVSASEDKTVRIWDVATGQQLLSFLGHKDFVNSIAVDPDGRFVASAGQDGAIKVWDAAHNRAATVLSLKSNFICSGGWSRDGDKTFLFERVGLEEFDARSSALLRTLPTRVPQIFALAWRPDYGELLYGAED